MSIRSFPPEFKSASSPPPHYYPIHTVSQSPHPSIPSFHPTLPTPTFHIPSLSIPHPSPSLSIPLPPTSPSPFPLPNPTSLPVLLLPTPTDPFFIPTQYHISSKIVCLHWDHHGQPAYLSETIIVLTLFLSFVEIYGKREEGSQSKSFLHRYIIISPSNNDDDKQKNRSQRGNSQHCE